MVLNDTLANALSTILQAEKVGKNECILRPVSTLIQGVLDVMKAELFIGDIERVEDGRGGLFRVQLLGRINRCGSVKPRFTIGRSTFEKFEKRYLPAKDVGILVVSTPQGVMTHYEAKKKNTGGRLLAYCY